MLFDVADVSRRLCGRQQIVDDRVDHRQRAVGDAGGSVARVEQQLNRPVLLEARIAGNRPVYDQHAVKIFFHASRGRFERPGRSGAPDASQSLGQCRQCVMVQGDGPRTAQALGSDGCRESFQSPWPYAARLVPGITRRPISFRARSTCPQIEAFSACSSPSG
jgi:hypothetical protein